MPALFLSSGDTTIKPSTKSSLKVRTLWANGISGYVKNQYGYIKPGMRIGESAGGIRGWDKGTLKIAETRNFRIPKDGAPYTIQSAVTAKKKGLRIIVDVVNDAWTVLSVEEVSPKVSPYRKYNR